MKGFSGELDRVLAALSADAAWEDWWTRGSKAPQLEVHLLTVNLPVSPVLAEAVEAGFRRGRRRHCIRRFVDVSDLIRLTPDERRQQALPAVLDAVELARQALSMPMPPATPVEAEPAPLTGSTLRRRRLRELLDQRGADLQGSAGGSARGGCEESPSSS